MVNEVTLTGSEDSLVLILAVTLRLGMEPYQPMGSLQTISPFAR